MKAQRGLANLEGRGSVRAGATIGSPRGSPSRDRAMLFRRNNGSMRGDAGQPFQAGAGPESLTGNRNVRLESLTNSGVRLESLTYNTGLRLRTVALAGAVVAVAFGAWAQCSADDRDTKYQLNLADLPGYRAALDGKPAASSSEAGVPKAVRFRDLWDQPNTFLGRRVIVKGRVERIFRQPAVGNFPPLAEVWITAPAGDPFCVVFAQPRLAPDAGRNVQFTGTFLKMVKYAASDGRRLAPLIVGDQPPVYDRDDPEKSGAASSHENPAGVFQTIGSSMTQFPQNRRPWWETSWVLALAAAGLATVFIVWQHMRTPQRRQGVARQRRDSSGENDPHLEFIN
jgi:hypothetical protein